MDGLYYRRKARTPFLSFTSMYVRHFSSGGARNSVRWTSRCVGVSHWAKSHPISHAASLFPTSPGHHYVPAVVTDTRLDGRRNRDPPQRGVPAQFDLAQRTEPLHWKVNRVSCILALKPFPTFCLSLGRKVAQTHNTHNSRASAIKLK